jgi:SAM-dependent methyltransferase
VGFFQYGTDATWGCPKCLASPRERYVNVALDLGLISVPRGGRILHVAPSEMSLLHRFRAAGTLVPGDLRPERYPLTEIQRLDLMDFSWLGRFDLIYASHVLEHVPEDNVALAQMHAQLTPGGQVWLLVPLHEGTTIDGTTEMSPSERERLFGQWDHLRQYGPDLADRMAAAGFEVCLHSSTDVDASCARKFGLSSTDVIFAGRKAAAGV